MALSLDWIIIGHTLIPNGNNGLLKQTAHALDSADKGIYDETITNAEIDSRLRPQAPIRYLGGHVLVISHAGLAAHPRSGTD